MPSSLLKEVKQQLQSVKVSEPNLPTASTNVLRNYDLIAGTASIIGQHSKLVKIADTTDEVEERRTTCNKDTGEKRTLKKWTRNLVLCGRRRPHICLATTIPVS